jgi:hypothetical protein
MARVVVNPDVACELLDMHEAGAKKQDMLKHFAQKTGQSITRQTLYSWIRTGRLEEFSRQKIKLSKMVSGFTPTADTETFLRSLRAAIVGLLQLGNDTGVADSVRRRAYETAGMLSIDGIEFSMEQQEVVATTEIIK